MLEAIGLGICLLALAALCVAGGVIYFVYRMGRWE